MLEGEEKMEDAGADGSLRPRPARARSPALSRERADAMRDLWRWRETLAPTESLRPRPARARSPALSPERAEEPPTPHTLRRRSGAPHSAPSSTPSSGSPRPKGADYLARVHEQARDERACWGRDMSPPVDDESLVRAAADYERGRRGHELCSPHTPSELAVARGHVLAAAHAAAHSTAPTPTATAPRRSQPSLRPGSTRRVRTWTVMAREATGRAQDDPLLLEEIVRAAALDSRIEAGFRAAEFDAPYSPGELSRAADRVARHAPDPAPWLEEEPPLPATPRRAVLARATRPPGATPSTEEFETIASAWSRARAQSRRLLASPSNCEDWSSGNELDEEKAEEEERPTQQSADGDGLLGSAEKSARSTGRERHERIRAHLAALRRRTAQQRAAPARASEDAEKGAPSKNRRRPDASTLDCVRAMGGPQKASLLGPIVKGPGPAPTRSAQGRPPVGPIVKDPFEDCWHAALVVEPTAVVPRPARAQHICVQPVPPHAVSTKTATPTSEENSVATLATAASTAPPPSVATLLEVEEATEMSPSRRPERTATTVLPIAAAPSDATPSSIASLGMEEDDADPAVAHFAFEETAPAPSPTGERPPPRPQPIAAVNHAATPFSMARLGAYLEDEGDPPAFAFTTATAAAATIYKWSPHERTPPAIVRTIASSLAALAREGHLEDDCDPPVARRWSPPRPQHDIVPTRVRGFVVLGGFASRFELMENGLGFRKGVG